MIEAGKGSNGVDPEPHLCVARESQCNWESGCEQWCPRALRCPCWGVCPSGRWVGGSRDFSAAQSTCGDESALLSPPLALLPGEVCRKVGWGESCPLKLRIPRGNGAFKNTA